MGIDSIWIFPSVCASPHCKSLSSHMPWSATLTQMGCIAFLHKRSRKIIKIKIELLAFLHTSILKFPYFCRILFFSLRYNVRMFMINADVEGSIDQGNSRNICQYIWREN